jgi:NAD(P)-dependent dehydrogenase (short-subunit alcohol dehydrogenase family)
VRRVDLGLDGKVAIVTGGSRGLGKVVARELAAEGVGVMLCARGIEQLEAAAVDLVSATGTEVHACSADVANPDDVARLVATTVAEFGRVDILVNNAASFRSGPLLELQDEDWIGAFNIKAVGGIRCARAVIPHMRANNWGRIINMAGGAARQVDVGRIMGPVNAAIVNFTKKLSDEVGQYGITVNVIYPGGGVSQTQRRAQQQGGDPVLVEANSASRRSISRPITPEETAWAVCFLASDRAAAITGVALPVDGGSARGIFY